MKKAYNFHLIVLGLLLPLFNHAQWFNRAHMNLSYGYRNHAEWNGQIYFLNHFTAGGGLHKSTIKTGPAYSTPTSTGLFYTTHHLKNRYYGSQFFAGISTCRMKKLDFDFCVGIDFIQADEYSDFVLKENEYSHGEWVEAKHTYSKSAGFLMRGNMMLEVSQGFGFNLCVEQRINPFHSQFNVFFGLNVGIIQDHSIIKQKDAIRRQQLEESKKLKKS